MRYGAPIGRATNALITIVTPRTFARRLQGEGKAERKRQAKGPGRAPTPVDVEQLILKLARENTWGFTRILGELRKPGVRNVCRTTVLNVLRDNGLDLGPPKFPRISVGPARGSRSHVSAEAVRAAASPPPG